MSNFPLLVWILGYRDLGEFHKAEIERIGHIRFLTDEPTRRLWLWARGFFKTTLISIAHTVYLVLNNPNIRILYVSYTLDVTKKFFEETKNHFTKNEVFRYFFKDICPKAGRDGKIEFGTTESFVIPSRTQNLASPTVMCAGVGTNLTGLHFDYIKISDLVNKDSVANDTQIQASKDYYSYLRPLFDKIKVPREDIEGTFYHFNDLNCLLNKSDDFEKSIIPAIINNDYVFPERIDQEALDMMLNDPTIGPMMVYPQILLKPFDPAKSKFQRAWVKEYEVVPEGLAEYICVDPASTVKKKSDYTVIEKWGIDSLVNHYLLDGIRDKLTIFQRIAEIVRMVKSSKRLCAVKYEVLGGRHGDLEALKEQFRKENLPVIPQETKSVSTSKKDRIEQRLVNQFFCGKIFLPKSIVYRSVFDGKTKDFVGEYLLEYLQFPFTEHDDILDCHSQMFEEPAMLIKGLTTHKKYERKQMTYDDLDKYYDRLDSIQKSNPFLSREQAYTKHRLKAIRHVLMRT